MSTEEFIAHVWMLTTPDTRVEVLEGYSIEFVFTPELYPYRTSVRIWDDGDIRAIMMGDSYVVDATGAFLPRVARATKEFILSELLKTLTSGEAL